jgi:hypothetical protein
MSPFDTRPQEFDMRGVDVMLAIPVNRDLPWQTAQSLVETVIALKERGIQFDVQFVVGSSIVEVARTKVADVFLKGSRSRLFMIDSDQAWKAKDFIRLLALSTKMDVVLAAYPAKRDPPTFLLSPEEGAVMTNEWGCLPVKGVGLGFTVVHRDVIQALSDMAPKMVFPDSTEPIPHIFRCDAVDGVFRGEDMAFFADVRALGRTVWLDPSVDVAHVGAKAYGGSIMDALRPA